MTNLDSIFKSRDITLPTKFHLVKATVFLVVMYGCESWTVKKAEHRRMDAFELWCWRRLLRVPWTARRPLETQKEGGSGGPPYKQGDPALCLQSATPHLLTSCPSPSTRTFCALVSSPVNRVWKQGGPSSIGESY